MKKTALYSRVSIQKEDGYSIEAQKEALQSYCIAKGFKGFEFYTDDGFTGANIEREDMKRLLKDISNGVIERVVVYKLDRLSRSLKDTMHLIEDVFIPNNVAFISITECFDTSTPIGRCIIAILSAFAQLERENIRERSKLGLDARAKTGLWKGGCHMPRGYDYNTETGELTPNKLAAMVEQIFTFYMQGVSPRKIAEKLNLKYEQTVWNILRNSVYAGFINHCGKVLPGRHKPIISVKTYEEVQAQMKLRSQKREVESPHLLQGLLYCGICSARMFYHKKRYRSRIECYSQQMSAPHMVKDSNCDNPKWWHDELEELVIADFLQHSCKIRKMELIEQKNNIVNILEYKKNELAKKIKRLYALYSNAANEILLETINKYQNELNALTKQISIEKDNSIISEQITTAYKQLETLPDAWQHMTRAEQKLILRTHIEKITLKDGAIHIDYKFDNYAINNDKALIL